jgi:tellurite resistance protein TerC
MILTKPVWMWLLFFSIVFILLIIDLGLFHKKNKEIGIKESLWMSAFYLGVSFLFGVWIYFQFGVQSFSEYLTGLLVEKSLAFDNIFLISLIFSSLSIPLKYQHRVLFWGILGVILLRGIMIGLGAHLVEKFSWILYIFSVFMIFTGIKMFFISEQEKDINKNKILKWMRKYFEIASTIKNDNFIMLKRNPNTRKLSIIASPLLVALILIEFTDLIFAVDSIPAIFTITKDPYIIYTSNIFAILGLRALYFSMAVFISRFYYLRFALALILIFIGSKIFIPDIFGIEKVPPLISLVVTFGLLVLGFGYSLFKSKTDE